MNSNKLNNFYKMIEVQRDSKDIQEFMCELRNYLKAILSGIEFFGSDSLNCIYGSYKNTGIIIDLSNGIGITITDNSKKELFEIFKPIFAKITGRCVTFSYDYYEGGKSYPTLEWSFSPVERLLSLTNDDSIKNLDDHYTTKIIEIIKSLGQQLMSQEGYELLFENADLKDRDDTYKYVQIQKMCPSLGTSILQSWTSSNRNQLVKRAS